jgi:hypothetical protein
MTAAIRCAVCEQSVRELAEATAASDSREVVQRRVASFCHPAHFRQEPKGEEEELVVSFFESPPLRAWTVGVRDGVYALVAKHALETDMMEDERGMALRAACELSVGTHGARLAELLADHAWGTTKVRLPLSCFVSRSLSELFAAAGPASGRLRTGGATMRSAAAPSLLDLIVLAGRDAVPFEESQARRRRRVGGEARGAHTRVYPRRTSSDNAATQEAATPEAKDEL